LTEGRRDPSCIFCRIVAGQAPGSLIYQNEQVAAFMALPQAGPGHVLVVPAAHYVNAYDLPLELAEPIFALSLRLARAVKRGLQPDGITMAQNSERGANQSVMHFHLHVVGRTAGQRLAIHDERGEKDRAELDRRAELIRAALEQE
jgi:histidine triad (HIT) family protein